MNRFLTDWQSAVFHDGKIHNEVIAAIARQVWADHDTLSARQRAFREGCIKDVIAGAACLTLSQKDRERILEAARPLLQAVTR